MTEVMIVNLYPSHHEYEGDVRSDDREEALYLHYYCKHREYTKRYTSLEYQYMVEDRHPPGIDGRVILHQTADAGLVQ